MNQQLQIVLSLLFLWALFISLTAAQSDDNSDYSDNRIDAVPTTLSRSEKLLKNLSTGANVIQNGVQFAISKFPLMNRTFARSSNSLKHTFGDLLNQFPNEFKAIFPGTNWCGAGNNAKNEDDLGVFKMTDACCRNHDNCPQDLEAGKETDGLYNNGLFTRSACSCDYEFYDCLKNVSSVVSNKIGFTYFDVLTPQCFALDYPVVRCTKRRRTILGDKKCENYELDYNKEKRIQWFDTPIY